AASVKKTAQDCGITINDFSFGGWDGSIGGNPTNEADHPAYFEQIQKMLDFANAIGCHKGITTSGMTQKDLTAEQMNKNLRTAFGKAAEKIQTDKVNGEPDHKAS
ncbi:MAG: hypothetical protein ACERIE_03835, partial [Methyloceanibacter sp.]